jgi:hypothetical protein
MVPYLSLLKTTMSGVAQVSISVRGARQSS